MDVLRRNQFVCIAQDKKSTLKWIDYNYDNSSAYASALWDLDELSCLSSKNIFG